MESQKSLEPLLKKSELLRQLSAKEITTDELMKECAYWACEHLEEYTPEEDPMQPTKLTQFQALHPKERAKVDTIEFWRHPDIFNYIEERNRRRNRNQSKMWWLKEWLKYIPEEDYPTRQKLKDKMMEYQAGYNEA